MVRLTTDSSGPGLDSTTSSSLKNFRAAELTNENGFHGSLLHQAPLRIIRVHRRFCMTEQTVILSVLAKDLEPRMQTLLSFPRDASRSTAQHDGALTPPSRGEHGSTPSHPLLLVAAGAIFSDCF